MANDAAVFLGSAREKAGNVDKGQQGNIESVAGSDKSGCLVAGVHVETAGHDIGLVGDDTHRFAVDPGKSGNKVGGKIGLGTA